MNVGMGWVEHTFVFENCVGALLVGRFQTLCLRKTTVHLEQTTVYL